MCKSNFKEMKTMEDVSDAGTLLCNHGDDILRVSDPNAPGLCSDDVLSTIREQALQRYLADWERGKAFTDAQSKALALFRSELKERGLLNSWWDNTLVFCRFCEARNWHVDKAVDMFCRHLEWRKANDLDLVQTAVGLMPRLLLNLQYPELPRVKELCCFSHHKVSKQGHPMYFDRIGALDLPALKKVTTLERLMRYVMWYQETTSVYRLPAASLAAGRLITTSVYVVDLRGFSLGKFNAETRSLLKSMAAIGADQYPQTMEKTLVINAPASFRAVWSFVRPMLDKRIIRSFSIHGGPSEYMPHLLHYLDEADLPVFLGGKDDSLDFVHEVGPWAEHLPSLV